MQRNIKLEIEYDGTDFSGWQTQANLRTVQKEIESSLEKILQEKVNLIGAGRTDSGVHAFAQVANFKTQSQLELDSIFKGLNSLLPADVIIKHIEEVNLDFNSRYSATSRRYRYRIFLGRTALLRKYVWENFYQLNFDLIQKATEFIKGKHDFSSFCVTESTKEDNHCKVLYAEWKKAENELNFEIEADRFLHSMVRVLVGTLIDVGRGYFSLKDFMEILKAKDRKKAGVTAPACGLYLVKVNY